MKKATTILFALSFLLVLWVNGKTHSSQLAKAPAGNIPDGMYMIVGEASHRCLEIPNSSCRDGVGLQLFDCDPTDASNNQKFDVAADGNGYYTITAAHSDLCLEVVSGGQDSDRISIQQNACSPDKISQKWAMSQYGVNLQIRYAGAKPGTNQCMDVMGRGKKNYGPVNLHPCTDGTNQRWRLTRKTLNGNGAICRASPSHPEHDCFGLNDKQTQVYLGKTLTKAKCEEACQASKVSGCKWSGPQ
jgi:hypothetical protein